MENEFVPYELALELKKLGFDEPCFGYYYTLDDQNWKFADKTLYNQLNDEMNVGYKFTIPALTYSQSFRWFREKYKLKHCIIPLVCEQGFSDLYESRTHQETQNISIVGNHKSYEEAELACLRKLIEIVKQNNK